MCDKIGVIELPLAMTEDPMPIPDPAVPARRSLIKFMASAQSKGWFEATGLLKELIAVVGVYHVSQNHIWGWANGGVEICTPSGAASGKSLVTSTVDRTSVVPDTETDQTDADGADGADGTGTGTDRHEPTVAVLGSIEDADAVRTKWRRAWGRYALGSGYVPTYFAVRMDYIEMKSGGLVVGVSRTPGLPLSPPFVAACDNNHYALMSCRRVDIDQPFAQKVTSEELPPLKTGAAAAAAINLDTNPHHRFVTLAVHNAKVEPRILRSIPNAPADLTTAQPPIQRESPPPVWSFETTLNTLAPRTREPMTEWPHPHASSFGFCRPGMILGVECDIAQNEMRFWILHDNDRSSAAASDQRFGGFAVGASEDVVSASVKSLELINPQSKSSGMIEPLVWKVPKLGECFPFCGGFGAMITVSLINDWHPPHRHSHSQPALK